MDSAQTNSAQSLQGRGLRLPIGVLREMRVDRTNALIRLLVQKFKIKAEHVRVLPDLHLWVKAPKGDYALTFDTEQTLVPAEVASQMISQWYAGNLKPEGVYRLLTVDQQIALSNHTGKAPVEKKDGQKMLEKEFDRRQDMRKHGADPDKEG